MIKGYKERVTIWSVIGLILLTILTFASEAPSWSANALLAYRVLLNAGLIAIADTFGNIAAGSPRKNEVFYKWFNTPIRLRHLARFTKYSFYGIIVLHFGHEYIPNMWHNIATGLAVLGFNLIMWRWHKTWSVKWWINMILTNVATILLILSFAFNLMEIKWPEFVFLLTGFYNLFKMRK